MCGIAGIYNSTLNTQKNLKVSLCSLTDMLKHRGPDGNGYKILDSTKQSHKTLFVHTRLRVLLI